MALAQGTIDESKPHDVEGLDTRDAFASERLVFDMFTAAYLTGAFGTRYTQRVKRADTARLQRTPSSLLE